MSEESEQKLIDALTAMAGQISRLGTTIEANIAATTKQLSWKERQDKTVAEVTQDLQDLAEALESNEITLKSYKEEVEKNKKKISETGKVSKELDDQFKAINRSTSNFTSTMATAGTKFLDIAKSTALFSKSIFETSQKQNPLEAAQAVAVAEAEGLSKGLSSASKTVDEYSNTVAGAAAILGPEAVVAVKIGAKVLSVGLELASQATKGFSEALKTVGPIISKFQDSYVAAGKAGATFAGGMTELRDASKNAGMFVNDLVGGVEKGADAFLAGGLNFTQATKAIGSMNKSLVEGKLASDLFALGFVDVKDRVALVGNAFERARLSGMKQAEATADLTNLTSKYAADLKTLQGVVGKNAEAEMRKAQVESMRSSLSSRLNKEQMAQFQSTFVTMAKFGPEQDKMRLGLEQILATGTTTIAEYAENPAIMNALNTAADNIRSGSDNATSENQKVFADLTQHIRDTSSNYQAIDDAALMGIDGFVNTVAQTRNNLAAVVFDPKAMEESGAAVTKLTGQTDDMTVSLRNVDTNMRAASVALEQLALSNKSITIFTGAMDLAAKSITKSMELLQAGIDKILNRNTTATPLAQAPAQNVTPANIARQIEGPASEQHLGAVTRAMTPTELLKANGLTRNDIVGLKGNIITLKDGRKLDTTKGGFVDNQGQATQPVAPPVASVPVAPVTTTTPLPNAPASVQPVAPTVGPQTNNVPGTAVPLSANINPIVTPTVQTVMPQQPGASTMPAMAENEKTLQDSIAKKKEEESKAQQAAVVEKPQVAIATASNDALVENTSLLQQLLAETREQKNLTQDLVDSQKSAERHLENLSYAT